MPNQELSDTDRSGPGRGAPPAAGWPFFVSTDAAPVTSILLGVMIDESFVEPVVHASPPGLRPVTSEMSIDLLWPQPGSVRTVRAVASPVGYLPDAVCARSDIVDQDGRVIASGVTWCRYIRGDRAGDPRVSAALPPPTLSMDDLLVIEVDPEDRTAAGTFRPTPVCGNDLGTLHGGIIAALLHDAGAACLATVGNPVRTSSIRVNYLRPNRLDRPVTVEATVAHGGRSVGIATVTTRDEAGRPTATGVLTAHLGSA